MALALALKYRPVSFSELIGQESVSQTLSLALDSSRVSHAYLFSGLRGSGKTSSARIFARALECEQGPTSRPCGKCDNCKSALENRHIDIIEMDAASSRKIDDIRDLIEQTKYRPSYGRYKIFIIDEVHMLTKEAFNALLKTLEEPPSYVKFILATTDPLKLPATILSRTQHFRFKKIPHKSVVTHIASILDREGIGYELASLEIIARSGAGSLRDTLTLTDQAINFCNKNITKTKVTEMLGVVDPEVLNKFFQALFSHDDDVLHSILTLLEEYECEMIVDEMMIFLKDALRDRNKDFSIIIVDRFLRILSESKYLLNINTDGGFVLLLLSLKMQEALKVKDIDSMISELEAELSTSFFSTPLKPILKSAGDDIPAIFDDSKKILQTPLMEKTSTLLQASKSQSLFQKLIIRIYDRNQELGEIFEKNVEFISFDNGVLSWKSYAEGMEKTTLMHNYPHIKMMVQELFGISTKISSIQTSNRSQVSQNSNQVLDVDIRNKSDIQENVNLTNASADLPSSITAQDLSSKALQQIFLEENKELVENIKTNLGATQMFVLEEK